jgi:transcription factor SOX9 (SOX group E)
MSRYPLEYSAQHGAPQGHAGDAGAFRASLNTGGHESRESQSPSDDGSAYLHYLKSENDLEGVYWYFPFATCGLMRLAEDPNASLIAQTLNTDGTPKRPMNAFMIFARRRRPQVSAENQSMRTGEISKILSKEWNAMDLVNKISPFLNPLN